MVLATAVSSGSDWRPALRMLVLDSLRTSDLSGLLTVSALIPPLCRDDAWSVLLQAEIARMSGDFRATQQALAAGPPAGDGALQALWHLVRIAAAFALGDHSGEATLVDLVNEQGDLPGWLRARTRILLGVHQFAALRLAEAQASYESALADCQDGDDPLNEIRARANLGTVLLARGRFAQARQQLETALGVARQSRQVPTVQIAVILGECLTMMGDYPAGLQVVDEGMSLARHLGIRASIANLHWVRAQLLAGMQDWDAAEAAAREALTQGDALGERIASWRGLACLVEIACGRQDLAAAEAWAAELQRRAGAELTAPRYVFALYAVIRLALTQARWRDAVAMLEPLIGRLQQERPPYALAVAWQALAEAREGLGLAAPAEAARAESRQLCEAYGLRHLLPADAIEVRCLGSFAVRFPSGETGVPGSNVQRLFMLLLLERAGLSRSALDRHLYGDQEVAKNTVPMLVNRLRRALRAGARASGPAVLFADGLYRLNPAWHWRWDLQEFQAAWVRAMTVPDPGDQKQAYRQMVHLYQGEVCRDWDDTAWLQFHREQARQRWQSAHQWLQRSALANADWLGALDLAEANLRLDPLSEVAHTTRIRALVGLGRLQEAQQCLMAGHAGGVTLDAALLDG